MGIVQNSKTQQQIQEKERIHQVHWTYTSPM